jgi:hypothetical protein
VADGDVDGDGIPDHADGYDLDPSDEADDGGRPELTEIKLTGGLDPNSATLVIHYSTVRPATTDRYQP